MLASQAVERPPALHVALQVIEALGSLGVRYHIGGSLASSVHGIMRQASGIHLVVALSPEDTMLRKLLWYHMEGEVSERQWTDVVGIARIQGDPLDREYLQRWARELGLESLLEKTLQAPS